MASLILTPENQIQRLNGILAQVEELKEFDPDRLTKAPDPKSWNVLEVLEHLSISYSLYVPKIEEALSKSPVLTEAPSGFKARRWQKIVIEGQRPKDGKRKWKIKTLKRFEPMLGESDMTPEKIESLFVRFFELHDHLKKSILESRSKDVTQITFSSAIGNIVRFYLPESFEFLICHMERHRVQIDEILGKL